MKTNQPKCECGDTYYEHIHETNGECTRCPCLAYRPAQQAEQCGNCGYAKDEHQPYDTGEWYSLHTKDVCPASSFAPPEASTPNAAAVDELISVVGEWCESCPVEVQMALHKVPGIEVRHFAHDFEEPEHRMERLRKAHVAECPKCQRNEDERAMDFRGLVQEIIDLTTPTNDLKKFDELASALAEYGWFHRANVALAATQPHTEVRETVDREARDAAFCKFRDEELGGVLGNWDGWTRAKFDKAYNAGYIFAADLEAGTRADKVREYEAESETMGYGFGDADFDTTAIEYLTENYTGFRYFQRPDGEWEYVLSEPVIVEMLQHYAAKSSK